MNDALNPLVNIHKLAAFESEIIIRLRSAMSDYLPLGYQQSTSKNLKIYRLLERPFFAHNGQSRCHIGTDKESVFFTPNLN